MNSTSDPFTTSTTTEDMALLLALVRSVGEMMTQANKLCGSMDGFLHFLKPSLLCKTITPDKNYDFIPNIRTRRLMPSDKVIYIKRKRRKQ